MSLDEADDDPVRFWTYLLTALQRDVTGLSAAPLGAPSTPGLESVDLALPTLLNELTSFDTEHVLLLDDYHLLVHPGIHESVGFLLCYLPAALRAVIADRSNPPLPLARLRACGELTELRAADLGFSVGDAAALLTAVGDTRFDASTAALLCERGSPDRRMSWLELGCDLVELALLLGSVPHLAVALVLPFGYEHRGAAGTTSTSIRTLTAGRGRGRGDHHRRGPT